MKFDPQMMDHNSNLLLNEVNKDHSGHYRCVERMNKNNTILSYTMTVLTTSNLYLSK